MNETKIKTVQELGISMSPFEKELMNWIDAMFEHHQEEIRQLNEMWENRLKNLEETYKKGLGIK